MQLKYRLNDKVVLIFREGTPPAEIRAKINKFKGINTPEPATQPVQPAQPEAATQPTPAPEKPVQPVQPTKPAPALENNAPTGNLPTPEVAKAKAVVPTPKATAMTETPFSSTAHMAYTDQSFNADPNLTIPNLLRAGMGDLAQTRANNAKLAASRAIAATNETGPVSDIDKERVKEHLWNTQHDTALSQVQALDALPLDEQNAAYRELMSDMAVSEAIKAQEKAASYSDVANLPSDGVLAGIVRGLPGFVKNAALPLGAAALSGGTAAPGILTGLTQGLSQTQDLGGNAFAANIQNGMTPDAARELATQGQREAMPVNIAAELAQNLAPLGWAQAKDLTAWGRGLGNLGTNVLTGGMQGGANKAISQRATGQEIDPKEIAKSAAINAGTKAVIGGALLGIHRLLNPEYYTGVTIDKDNNVLNKGSQTLGKVTDEAKAPGYEDMPSGRVKADIDTIRTTANMRPDLDDPLHYVANSLKNVNRVVPTQYFTPDGKPVVLMGQSVGDSLSSPVFAALDTKTNTYHVLGADPGNVVFQNGMPASINQTQLPGGGAGAKALPSNAGPAPITPGLAASGLTAEQIQFQKDLQEFSRKLEDERLEQKARERYLQENFLRDKLRDKNVSPEAREIQTAHEQQARESQALSDRLKAQHEQELADWNARSKTADYTTSDLNQTSPEIAQLLQEQDRQTQQAQARDRIKARPVETLDPEMQRRIERLLGEVPGENALEVLRNNMTQDREAHPDYSATPKQLPGQASLDDVKARLKGQINVNGIPGIGANVNTLEREQRDKPEAHALNAIGEMLKPKPVQPTPEPVKPEPIKPEPQADTATPDGAGSATSGEVTSAADLERSPSGQVADEINKVLSTPGNRPISQRVLQTLMDWKFDGTMAEGKYSVQDMWEALELSVNKYILGREGFKPDSLNTLQNLKELRKLLDRLPTQTSRGADKDSKQQFSTPPTIAYAANWLANISGKDTVLEPSAGVGGLAVFAKKAGARVVANELSERRAALLKELGFDEVYGHDGKYIEMLLPKDVKPTVVVMNPPFSSDADLSGKKKDTNIGHIHVEAALKKLEPGGRLVTILGQGSGMGTAKGNAFWKKLGKEYEVRAVVGLSGNEYKKYGTKFGNVIAVIDKTAPGPYSRKTYVKNFETLEDLVNDEEMRIIRNILHYIEPDAETKKSLDELMKFALEEQKAFDKKLGITSEQETEPTPTQPRPTKQTKAKAKAEPIKPEPKAQPEPKPQPEIAQEPEPKPEAKPEPEINPVQVKAKTQVQQQNESKKANEQFATEQQDDESKFMSSRMDLQIDGAKPHKADLAESIAMASVRKPQIDYALHIPQKVITEGGLSEAQLEAVAYAGNAFQKVFDNGTRRGFWIGDGTGVGKTREILGVIMDQWAQGIGKGKAVIISDSNSLLDGARKDWEALGNDPNEIFAQQKIKGTEQIERDGILFTAYSTI